MAGRLDDYQRRHRWLGLPLAVVYKFFDDQAGYLTALLTYYGFLSLFPLLLLLVTTMGFLLQGSPELQQRLLDSALSQFPVFGAQLGDNVHELRGNGTALLVGLVVCIYGCMGVAQAGQNAMNRVWAVSRNARPNPIKSRLRSLFLVGVVGGGILVTTVLSGLITSVRGYGLVFDAAATVVAVVLNTGLFVVAYRVLTVRPLTVRQVRTGALAAAVSWQLLQFAGTFVLSHLLRDAGATYGVFGVVLGLIGWIYLGAFTVLLCAEFNVVRVDRLWPRSLLTPFTDDVRLTLGDRKAYESYVRTERHKGFQTVEVDFDEPGERD